MERTREAQENIEWKTLVPSYCVYIEISVVKEKVETKNILSLQLYSLYEREYLYV